MEQKKTRDLAALSSIPLIMTLGNSMLIPVLPNIEKQLGITSFQSSLIITVFSVSSIFFIPVAGFLSDRYGRKKVMVPSLIVTGIGGAVSGLASIIFQNPYYLILVGRLIQGIGSSGAFPVVIPTVGDMFKEESDVSKALGIIETANTFGKVLSPILGSLLALWFWYVPFLAIPAFSGIAIALIAFFVKAPKKDDQSSISFKAFCSQVKDILKQKGDWLYAIFFLGWTAMFVYFGFLFFFTNTLENIYGIAGIKRGFIISIPLLALCVTSFTIGKVIGKNKKLMKWIILAGNLLTAGALFAIGFSASLTMLVIVLSAAAIGIGASLPSLDALITEGIDKKNRGTITCFYSSMRMLGVAVGPPAAAILLRSGTKIAFIILAAVNVAAAGITMLFVKPPEER